MPRLAARPLVLALSVVAACGTRTAVERPDATVAPVAAAVAPPSAPALLDEARQLRADGDLAGARLRLEAAHAAAPAAEDVRLELVQLLVSDGAEPERAAALLDGISDRGADWHLADARVKEVLGDEHGAAGAYGRVLEEAPAPDPELRLRRALLLERLGRADEALSELERLGDERPGDALAALRRAALYEAAGRLALAERELVAIAEAQPERVAGWQRLAAFYERAGRPAEARAALARAKGASGGGRALRPLLPSRR